MTNRRLALLLFPTLAAYGCGGACPPNTESGKDGNCVFVEGVGDGTGASDGTGTGTDDGGTTDPGFPADEITAEVSEVVHTVVTVRWTTAQPTTGLVEFGETDAYGMQTRVTEEGTSHEVLLLGLWAETEFHFRVKTTSATGAEALSEDLTITTLSLPPDLPGVAVTGTPTFEGYLVAPVQGSAYGTVIFDTKGRFVWYYLMEDSDFHIMRALPSPDGADVVVCMAGQDNQGNKEDGYLLEVSMDGYTVETIPAPNIDHDLTILPNGTVAAIVLVGDEAYPGQLADSIQEIDRDGNMTEIFNAWDHIAELLPGEGPSGGGGSWTHANAIDYDASEDAYYLAMKNLYTTAKIPRATGQIEWALGGKGNQFTWAEGTEELSMHHQFHAYDPTHIVYFENGTPDRAYSRAREIEINPETMVATGVWDYSHQPPLYVFSKGDVTRLPNGHTLVTWSSSGEIQEVDEEGVVVWQLNMDLGSAFSFVWPIEGLYGW